MFGYQAGGLPIGSGGPSLAGAPCTPRRSLHVSYGFVAPPGGPGHCRSHPAIAV